MIEEPTEVVYVRKVQVKDGEWQLVTFRIAVSDIYRLCRAAATGKDVAPVQVRLSSRKA